MEIDMRGGVNAASYVANSMLIRERLKGNDVAEQVKLRLNQLAALCLIILASPVLLLVAGLIWHSDGAPVMFGHYRVGAGGRMFRCLKFRTMRRDADKILSELLETDFVARAEWQSERKLTDDPRVTRIGKLLRRTSLDELPQLFNVLRGEMNLVGPRPVTAPELRQYGAARWHYLSVRPGITGMWQVSGRNNTSYVERVALDRDYVENRSLRLDVSILMRTVVVVVSREGAR